MASEIYENFLKKWDDVDEANGSDLEEWTEGSEEEVEWWVSPMGMYADW